MSWVALAAVAATGVAFAQNVTLSGSISAGYKTSVDKDEKSVDGFGFDDNEFRMSVSEDLGGGLKASATMTFEGAGDGDSVTGDGAVLSLSGGFGSLTFSDVSSSDYLPIDGLTNHSNGTNGDRVTYALPTIVPGVTASVTYKDGSTGDGYGKKAFYNTNISYSLGYTAGPLTAGLVYADFTDRNKATETTADESTFTTNQSRTGIKVGYDFGVAAVTYGQLSIDNGTAPDVKETGLTVSAPVGPVTLTASYATYKRDGAKKRDGNAFGATYALSKRTSVVLYTESYENPTAGKKDITESSLLLVHKF